MNDAGLSRVIEQATEKHPAIRWAGVLLDDGDQISLCGTLDGLSATQKALGASERTVTEASNEIVDRLRHLWR